MSGTIVDRPLCECHGEPMNKAGKWWRCRVKNRETLRAWRDGRPREAIVSSKRVDRGPDIQSAEPALSARLRDVSSTPTYGPSQYLKHARSFGTEQVYETAVSEIGLNDLVELVHGLRDLPPQGGGRYNHGHAWKLTKEQRDRLAKRLIESGSSDAFIRAACDCNQATILRLRQALIIEKED